MTKTPTEHTKVSNPILELYSAARNASLCKLCEERCATENTSPVDGKKQYCVPCLSKEIKR